VSLPSQLVLINMSLAINDALMHIPNFYVFWNLGSIVSGAIFYQEFAELDHVALAIFFAGVIVLIFAVCLTNISVAQKQKLAQVLAEREAERDVNIDIEFWRHNSHNETTAADGSPHPPSLLLPLASTSQPSSGSPAAAGEVQGDWRPFTGVASVGADGGVAIEREHEDAGGGGLVVADWEVPRAVHASLTYHADEARSLMASEPRSSFNLQV